MNHTGKTTVRLEDEGVIKTPLKHNSARKLSVRLGAKNRFTEASFDVKLTFTEADEKIARLRVNNQGLLFYDFK